jgi:hypothetical protein
MKKNQFERFAKFIYLVQSNPVKDKPQITNEEQFELQIISTKHLFLETSHNTN